MAEYFINQDPIEVVTTRVLPSGDVEALLRLSERDMALLADPHPRYSIAPNPPIYYVEGIPLDGGPVGEAAEHGRDIERLVGIRIPAIHDAFRQEREGTWSLPERCRATWVIGKGDDLLDDAEHNPDACGAHAVFWPDVEACDAWCARPKGHDGTEHEDDILGTWDEETLMTTTREEG